MKTLACLTMALFFIFFAGCSDDTSGGPDSGGADVGQADVGQADRGAADLAPDKKTADSTPVADLKPRTPDSTLPIDASVADVAVGGCKSNKACGSKSKFCKFALGDCGKGKTGVCTQRPGMCTKIYRPVCGCDGKTYGNACEAASAGMSIAANGRC